MIEASQGQMLRGVSFDGQTAVFDAAEASHMTIRDILGYPAVYDGEGCGSDFWVLLDGMEPDTGDWETSPDDPVRDGLRLLVGGRPEELMGTRIHAWFVPDRLPAP